MAGETGQRYGLRVDEEITKIEYRPTDTYQGQPGCHYDPNRLAKHRPGNYTFHILDKITNKTRQVKVCPSCAIALFGTMMASDPDRTEIYITEHVANEMFLEMAYKTLAESVPAEPVIHKPLNPNTTFCAD